MSTIQLVRRAPAELFARWGSQDISVAQFCADINDIAESLPDCRFLVNLCQDRYLFTATFFAALVRGQTNLLAAKRDVPASKALADRYPNLSVVADQALADIDHHIELIPGAQGEMASASCPGNHLAAIAFTSGSTGEPQAHHKSWAMLDTWRQQHAKYLAQASAQPRAVVATVPSWHMYGLEWAMLLPTLTPVQLYCGADFYPKDVISAIAEFDAAVVLVTTPMHLRALTKAQAPDQPLGCIISATAPLDPQLISGAEAHFASQIFEIYGCSEIGSLAYRFPGTTQNWRFFDCFDVHYTEAAISVDHPLLERPVTLTDQFEAAADHTYQLVGRATDMIKVGGKRESLANLNSVLVGLDGVDDGIIYDPNNYLAQQGSRLAALVVAPELDSQEIRNRLATQLDSAFIPRPIRKVEALPRDTTSKLKHADLAALILQLSNADG